VRTRRKPWLAGDKAAVKVTGEEAKVTGPVTAAGRSLPSKVEVSEETDSEVT